MEMADFDPELPVAPGLEEIPFSVIDDTDRMTAEIIPNTALPGDLLDPDTSYLVYFDDSILSVGEVDEDGNILRHGRPLEPKMWTFKTRVDGTFCMADNIAIEPDPFTAYFIEEKTKYSAYPYTNPDQCSPVGQKLNPWSFGWNWDTSDHNVAVVSDFMSAGELKPFCGLGCLPMGSDIGREGTIPPLCGNDVIDPGEECDDGVNNGAISGQTFADWTDRVIGHFDTYPVGTVSINYGARGIDVNGNIVYVVHYGGSGSKFQVVDATNPANPILRGSLPLADLNIGLDVEVVNNRAYIASYLPGALVIADVSNPSSVSTIANVSIPLYGAQEPYPLEVDYFNGYVYVGGYRGIDVIDASNPGRGVIHRDQGGYVNDLEIFERSGQRFLYAAQNTRIYIYNITDQEADLSLAVPTAISFVGRGSARSVDVQGNYAFFGLENYGFEIFDTTDPMNPVLVSSVNTGTLSSAIRVSGDYLYLANREQNRLLVYNISDVNFPILIGEYNSNIAVHDVVFSGDRAFTAEATDGFAILDTAQRLYCSSNCGGYIKSFCGNGYLEPGEDCDIGIAGEVVGSTCSLDCLRPGNDNISCGNNILETNLGEECDPGPTSATRVGCSDRCVHLGSTRDPNAATIGLPLCGDSEVTVGEDCEAGVNGETGGSYVVTEGDSDLRGLWHFNEFSGPIIDATTYHNDGSQFGVSYNQTGRFGGALGFDGATDYVNVPNSNSLNIIDDITLNAWINPDFDADPIEILIVEGAETAAWVTEFESLGYDVTVDTGITTVAQVDAINPDIVACIQTAWACGKGDLYNDLYSSGHILFTEGNDSYNNIRPIVGVFQMSDEAGQIVPEGTHPINNGWATTFNSGGDVRQGVLSIHSNAYPIAVDDMLGYIEAIYLEESGSGRWFHLQPGWTADPTLVENAVSYLTRDEIAGKGDAYNLFLNNQTLSGFINNHLVSADINAGWNQVVLSYDGAVENLYVNGDLEDSNSFAAAINSNTAGLSVGKKYSGLIDEAQVWNTVLSQSEISNLYNAENEFDVSSISGSALSEITSGLTCSANCLHIGTDLAREWCDDNISWTDSNECAGATSVCGNAHLESGEECEIINNQFYLFDGSWGVDGTDNGRLISGVLPSDFEVICSDECLLQDICGYPALTPFYCDPATQEGCKPDCTLHGSSIERYIEPSLCGDSVVGAGEYGWCEYTPAELAIFTPPGQNPVQSVRAVGLGELDPDTQLQSAVVEANIVRVRGEETDLTPEQQAQLTGEGDYYLQCGFEEFYEMPLPGLLTAWSAEGDAEDNQDIANCVLEGGMGFDNDGASGSAFTYDGVDDGVSCPPNAALYGTNAVTMEAWFKIPVHVTAYDHKMVLQNQNSANYMSLIGNSSVPMMSLRIDGTQRTLYSNFTPELNTWYHFVGTYDGSVLRIYINGVLRNTSPAYPGVVTYYSTYGFFIGRNYNASNYRFNGSIDEVAIYNRALTQAEILANYNSQSSRENYNLCPEQGYGVGSNSCCYPRPTRMEEYPADGAGILDANAVCLNSLISVTFDGDISETTLASNILLAKGYEDTPPADCVNITDMVENTLGLAYENNASSFGDSFFENIWNLVKRFFAWLTGSNKAEASITNVATIDYWCRENIFNGIPQVSKTEDANGDVIESKVDVYLNELMDQDSYYAVMLLGGRTGIKDVKGVSIGNPDDISDADDSFIFRTGDDVCRIASVIVTPGTYFYSTPNTDYGFVAEVESTNGQFITPIVGVYDWEWFWTPSADTIFTINPDAVTPGTAPNRVISSTELEGARTVGAHATVLTDIDPIDSQVGETFTGTTELTSMFCENSWPPRLYFPFEDETGNNDGAIAGIFDGSVMEGTGPASDQYFNFQMDYCADNGLSGNIIDDLPYLKPFVFNTVDGLPDVENLKRVLFFNDINDDVIGLQVFKTEDAPTILEKETLGEWFLRKIGIPSGFNQISIDGYDAMTNGSNYYISSVNRPADGQLYRNIFVFSINENAQQITYDVFEQLINSLEFNTNLSDNLYCDGAVDILCFDDFNCLDTLGNPLGTPAGTGECSADKTKMRRDWGRLETIANAQTGLNNYVSSTGAAPQLTAGTYIPGKTRSVWPSWGNIGQSIGGGVGIDPINRWTSCNYCHVPGQPIDGIEQLCSSDDDCTGAGEICVSIDSQTCWDEINSRFICPAYSSIFGYRTDSTVDYMLHANLEYFGLADLASFVDVDHLTIGSMCGAPGTTESPLSGNCGNGVVNLSEECDPPGQLVSTANACTGSDGSPGTYVEVCNNSCLWQASGCDVEVSCGNGRLDADEQCDDGALNGTPGNCSAVCTDSPYYCGDGTRDSYCSFNNVYCTGDPNICLTSCGTNRNCQAMNICSPVEFCDRGGSNGDYLMPPGAYASNINSCSSNCKQLGPRCGDGVLHTGDAGEACATGVTCDSGSCAAGNICAPLEECDDGNITSGDGCANNCRNEAVEEEDITPELGDCGNGVVNTGEVCDRGDLNGVQCVPGYNESCNYCSWDCEEVLYVEPNAYCGNQSIDMISVVEYSDYGNVGDPCTVATQDAVCDSDYCIDNVCAPIGYCTLDTDCVGSYCVNNFCSRIEACEYVPMNCTGSTCVDPYIITKTGTIEIDQCSRKWGSYSDETGLYTAFTGTYECRNSCRFLDGNCVPCGSRLTTDGGVRPVITLLNPMVSEYREADWLNGGGMFTRFYFRDYNEDIDEYILTEDGSEVVNYVENTEHPPWGAVSKPENVFSDSTIGLISNSSCSEVYKVCFSPHNTSVGEDGEPLCLEENLDSEFLWDYEVNNNINSINDAYTVSPAVPEGTIRIVLTWTREEAEEFGGTTFSIGSLYYDGADTYSNRMLTDADSLCTRILQDGLSYWVPNYSYECDPWPATISGETINGNEGVYMHTVKKYGDGYPDINAYMHSLTINAPDTTQTSSFLENAPYAIFVEAQGATMPAPMAYFDDSDNIRVDIYEYKTIPTGGSPQTTIFKPTQVFPIDYAQESSNPGARYWHLFNIVRDTEDSDEDGNSDEYLIVPVNKIVTGATEIQEGTIIPDIMAFCGNGRVDINEYVTEVCDTAIETDCLPTCDGYTVCGNGLLERNEDCDNGVVTNFDCLYGQETCLVCGNECTYVSGVPNFCGDGDFDGERCVDFSEEHNGSEMRCRYSEELCTSYLDCGEELCDPTVSSYCVDNGLCNQEESFCGDFVVQTPNDQGVNEDCDPVCFFNCDNPPYYEACGFGCQIFTAPVLETDPGAVCGNNIIEGGEECDGTGVPKPFGCGACLSNCTCEGILYAL